MRTWSPKQKVRGSLSRVCTPCTSHRLIRFCALNNLILYGWRISVLDRAVVNLLHTAHCCSRFANPDTIPRKVLIFQPYTTEARTLKHYNSKALRVQRETLGRSQQTKNNSKRAAPKQYGTLNPKRGPSLENCPRAFRRVAKPQRRPLKRLVHSSISCSDGIRRFGSEFWFRI